MICKQIVSSMPEPMCFHTVKCLQVLLLNAYNSIQHQL